MALQQCPECSGQISDAAFECTHCGHPLRQREAWLRWGYEWKSRTTVLGVPLVHVAFGFKPGGGLHVARGIVAIGQFGIGLIAITQFGVGLLFGLGQFILAPVAIAQFAVGLLFGLGQFATGVTAIGQVVAAAYGYCQIGAGPHIWSSGHSDPAAVEFFGTWFGLHGGA